MRAVVPGPGSRVVPFSRERLDCRLRPVDLDQMDRDGGTLAGATAIDGRSSTGVVGLGPWLATRLAEA